MAGGLPRRRARRRTITAALVASATAALALAPGASASHPACPEWRDGLTAYAYPFSATPFDLPECRLGRSGAEDAGTHAQLPARINMRREIPTLEPNPIHGRVRWTFVDSLGRPVAVLTRHADRWETTHPVTGAVIHRDRSFAPDQLSVQGRGCMATDLLEDRYALVAFAARDRTSIPAGASVVPYQVRAFLPRAALPDTDPYGRPVRGAVDDYRSGCGTAAPLAAPVKVADPAWPEERQFYGQDGRARTYATYNVKRRYGGVRYLLINTTGVGGGGIVRAVIRADDRIVVDDGLGYCDPNAAPQGAAPVASWMHGTVAGTRIAGWLPRRC